jgi:hypothetical protein
MGDMWEDQFGCGKLVMKGNVLTGEEPKLTPSWYCSDCNLMILDVDGV